MDKLQGWWMRGRKLDLRADQLPPNPDGSMRLGARVFSDGKTLVLSHSHPGQHSLYYLRSKKAIYFGESLLPLRQIAASHGVRTKVEFVQAGETVTLDMTSVRSEMTPFDVPAIRAEIGAEEALDAWWGTYLSSVEEMYRHHGGGPVCVASSGGTDSFMVLLALKEIGADVESYSAGMAPENFDPRWAKVLADHIGVPFTFVEIPTEEGALQALLRDTLAIIEQTSFSNVLMGLACTALQRVARDRGRPMVYTGYHADILMGNKLIPIGEFRKLPEAERTSEAWRDIRAKFATGMIPNTHQLHKNFSRDGFEWRAPFGHPAIMEQALSLPHRLLPDNSGHKVFLETLLNRFLPEGKRPWEERNKVGFYTGAGLGSHRLEHPILQDANIQATFREVQSNKP